MKRLSKKETTIFVICALLVSFYISANFIFKPMRQRLRLLEARILKKEKTLKRNSRYIQRGGALEIRYNKYAELVKQEASNEQEMAAILSEIESAASKIAMRVADMKPKRVKKIDFLNHFSVSLSIEGELNPIINFLYKLQNVPHLFNVDELRLEKRSLRTSKIRCRLVLSRTLIP